MSKLLLTCNSHTIYLFFSSVTVYLLPPKRSDRDYIQFGDTELCINKILKYPVQMLEEAGDLQLALDKFENPEKIN